VKPSAVGLAVELEEVHDTVAVIGFCGRREVHRVARRREWFRKYHDQADF
jgi:hypothetical protein